MPRYSSDPKSFHPGSCPEAVCLRVGLPEGQRAILGCKVSIHGGLQIVFVSKIEASPNTTVRPSSIFLLLQLTSVFPALACLWRVQVASLEFSLGEEGYRREQEWVASWLCLLQALLGVCCLTRELDSRGGTQRPAQRWESARCPAACCVVGSAGCPATAALPALLFH